MVKIASGISDAEMTVCCDNGMDWSIYDNDGNGTVDALNIVYSTTKWFSKYPHYPFVIVLYISKKT